MTLTAPEAQTQMLGCGAAMKMLAQMFADKTLAGSWLFCGPKGVGKATLAYRLARYVLANSAGGGESLFGAPAISDTLQTNSDDYAFKAVAARTHPDLAVLERALTEKELKDRQAILDAGKPLDAEAEKFRKRNNEIRVEDVRKVDDFLHRTSASGGWRVLIVDSADDMNANAANAFLKSLEEPAPDTLMILIAHHPASLLPTIRSRCRKITLQPLNDADMQTLAAQYLPDAEAHERDALCTLAQGSIGDAIFLAQNGGAALYENLLTLFRSFPDFDIPALYAFAEKSLKEKDAADVMRKFWSLLLNKALLTKFGRASASGVFEPEADVLARLAALPAEFLLDEVPAAQSLLADADLDAKQVFVNMCLRLQRGGA